MPRPRRVIWPFGLAPLALLATAIAAAGCERTPDTPAEEKRRPVRVLRAQSQERPVRLHYIGSTNSNSIRKLSFKVAGKVKRIFVEKGQQLHHGDLLAQLETKDLAFAHQGSQYQLDKAEEAAREAESFFEKIAQLYRQGAVTQMDYDKAKLNVEVSQGTFRQALVDLEHKKSLLGDTRLVAEVDGFVVAVIAREGEVVGAGHPVVVVRNDRQVVNVGVSQRDVKRLRVGTRARVDVDGAVGEGHVINISQIPDLRSRTYDVEVELTGKLAESEFYIGSIAKVDFEIGSRAGIWIPIQSVLTDGVDYAFVVQDGRAVRRDLRLGSVEENRVEVQGIQAGADVVVEGMKNLKEGYAVLVVAEDGARDVARAPGPARDDAL